MVLPIQAFLFVVILIITAVLTAVGIQLFFTLKEFRQAAEKINKILQSAQGVSTSVSETVTGIIKKFAEFSFAEVTYNLVRKLAGKGKGKNRRGVEKDG